MIVIKLGGSLVSANKIQACLDQIEHVYQHKNVVIVPGGGVFADQVRNVQQQWHFNDRAAHQMAILAMQQMALLLNALQPGFMICASVIELRKQMTQKAIVIWSPDVAELDKAGIQPSWDMTSDSLSAWLATVLGAEELLLVKSVKIDDKFDVLKLVQQQIVDAEFYKLTHHASFKLNIVHAEKFLS